jgi:CheY-like chemotaxis protein
MADETRAMSRLLVVDDEEGMRDTLRDILEEFGYCVEEAANGEEAVKMVCAGEYDLLLMDIRMPIMDGVSALGEIKQIRPGVPVIMMTAYAQSDAVEQARRCGATDILYKPLDIGKVLPLIERTLCRDE